MTSATGTASAADPSFVAPRPGGWQRLADHFPDAVTAEYQLVYSEAAPPAFAAGFERYGVLARGLDVAYINGHVYIAPIPLAGPREMKRTPPDFLVWLMSRAHPAFRKRNKRAQLTLEARPWRAVCQHWFDVERFEWQQLNNSLQALDPTAMTVSELRTHLTNCRAHAVKGYSRHFALHGDDLLPVGLLIVRCGEWGIEPALALRALDGSARGEASTDETPAWQLVTGYDLDAHTWGELKGNRSPASLPPSAPADLSSLIPEEDRAELKALVEDARTATRFRDDNGLMTGAWPMGLLRRVMLGAGRRLGFGDPALAIEMTVAELLTALQNPGQFDSGPIVERREIRRQNSALDAPLTLGPKFPIPTLSALPRPLALIGAAQLASAEHMTGIGDEPVGIGTASFTGRALVVDDPLTAFDVFEPGDIVMTRFTSPSWNALLLHAGALVTTTGGLASHAATIARELGLPAVIGDTTAVKRFRTGDLVVVNPVDRTVVLAAS